MRKTGLMVGIVLLLTLTAGAAMAWEYGEGVFANSQWASSAGASYYHVVDQTVDQWGDDGDGNPVSTGTVDNNNTTVIQGADQNWGGTANIMPGLITYDNILGAPDYAAAGWGGAASGGTMIIVFDEDIVDGDDDVIGQNASGDEVNYGGIDFMVHGFGFCFNQAFSLERGTVKIYAATADYNPTISAADTDGPGPLGEVTITGDESQWKLLSEYTGYEDGIWSGNPNMDYTSGPGSYGQFLWGDLANGGLERARYIKIVLGDGGHFINDYTDAEDNNGRALFIDAVEARTYQAPTNQPPVLESIGNKDVDEDAELSFTLAATDPDGDNLSFSYTSDPAITGSISLNETTGAFSWTPPDGAAGIYKVTFTVTDDGSPSASDQETIEITVGDVNHPPVFGNNTPALTYATLEGQTISFDVIATDRDGDDISYEVSGMPDGAEFSNGTFSWETTYEDADAYTLTFTATDNGSPAESVTKQVALTVGNVNRAPLFGTDTPADSYTASEGEKISFSVSATDPDGDEVNLGVTGLPDNANFSDGTFSWVTTYEDGGTHTLVFTAEDNGTPAAKTTTKQVTLSVGNINQAPSFNTDTPADSYAANEGETISFNVSATDPDGDDLSFGVTGLPDGATFSDGVFNWKTGYEDAGTHTLTFTVEDNGTPAASATKQVVLTVTDVYQNKAPVFDANAPDDSYTANEGEKISFVVSATDPEGDGVSLCIAGLPDGADFSNDIFSWTTDSGDAGAYTLTFTATDDGTPSNYSTKSVALTVVAVGNQIAGPDQTVTEQTPVTLGIVNSGEEQTDTYQWEQTSGPEITLSDTSVAAPTFIAPKVEAEGAVLSFQVTLNADLTDEVTITVQDNEMQLTTAEVQQFEKADLVFDNSIGADINAQEHCHMGIANQEGELTFYDILDPADMDTGDTVPENLIYGLFEFELTLPAGTQTAVWSVFLPEPAPEDYRWYKYNAATGEWIDFSRDVISDGTGDGAVFNEDRTRVTLYVTDGGAYDDDGLVNQKVSDPSGLGTQSATGDNDDTGGGGGGGGGCFVGTLVDRG